MSPAIWSPRASNISSARSVSRIAIRSGIRTMKNDVRRWSTMRSVNRVIFSWISWSSLNTSSWDLRPFQGRGDRFVLLSLLASFRDLPDPLAEDARHRDHPDAVAERGHIEHVQVVATRRHEVGHCVVRGRLVHGRFGGRRVDVLLDFGRNIREAIHGPNLLLHLLLILGHAPVRVDLHDVQVWDHGDEAFSEDVPVEDVAQARLRIGREAEDLPIPFRSHVMA